MSAGLLVSVVGNAFLGGIVPAGVALGSLPVVLLPIMRSVESVEDMLSALVARLMERYDPGRILVDCEVIDVVTGIVALTVVAIVGHPFVVAFVYICIVSPIPLVVDVAEELFAGSIARISPSDTLAFTATLYTLIGLTGALVATPLGGYLATLTVSAAIAANVAATAVAVALRSASVRAIRDATAPNDQFGGHGGDIPETASARPSVVSVVLSTTMGSPLASGLLAGSSALLSGYLIQWAVRDTGHTGARLVIVLVSIGVGATCGPTLSSWGSRRFGFRRTLLGLTLGRLGLLGALLVAISISSGPDERVVSASVFLALFGMGSTGSAVVQATARQVSLRGIPLAMTVGWSHTFAAAGGLAGVWLGYACSAQTDPTSAATVAIVAVAGLAWIAARQSDVGLDQSAA